MHSNVPSRLIAAFSFLLACTPSDDRSATTWAPPALEGADAEWQEPDARDVIADMLAFVASQRTFRTEALVSYESVQESGQKLQFDMVHRVAMQQPDKLFWTTVYDDGSADSAWMANGEFTLLRQPANVWGRINVPPTVPAAIRRLIHEYDLDVPFPEILGRDPYLPLVDDVSEVWWVGEAWIEGHWTDHIAIRRPDVDAQVWVRKGEEPFPAKIALTFVTEDGQPTYIARFRRWSTALPNVASQFTFTPPPDAERIEVVPVSSR